MFGPVQLTHLLYVCIPIVFLCVIAYMVFYNLQQKKKVREAVEGGARPETVEQEVILAKRQTVFDDENDKL